MLHFVNVKEIERFHKLYRRIFNVMEDLLDECLKKTENMIKQLIEIEMGYINNNHPDFIDTLTSVQSHEKQNSQDEKEKEEDLKELRDRSISSVSVESTNYLQITDIYNISKAVSHFPRELLPQVPEVIRVLNPPKRR
ncbi:unnamed protein product [Sphagnum jensenii]